MNTKTILAAAALALIGTASFAGEVTEFAVPTGSALTRAEVRAELLRSQASNSLVAQGETYGNVPNTFVAQRPGANPVAAVSRGDVKAELVQSQADRTLLAGEAYGTVVPGNSQRTRAEVRAQAIAVMHGAQVRAVEAEATGS